MDWIPLLGAVGAGAIATKVLDVLWVQRVLQDSERRKWLREQRYRAYGELARELLTSYPLSSQKDQQLQLLIADALFLTTDKPLIGLLQGYYPAVVAARQRLNQSASSFPPGQARDQALPSLRDRETADLRQLSTELVARLRMAITEQ
jgi:hypothetical protein